MADCDRSSDLGRRTQRSNHDGAHRHDEGDQTAIGRHMARVGSAPRLAKSSDNYHLQSLVGCSRSQVVVYGGFLPDINWCHVRSRLPDTWANVLRHRCTADMVAIPCDGPPILTDVEAMERDGIIVRRGRQPYSVPVLRPGGTKDNAILLCDLYRLTPKGVALCQAHGITALESSA